MAKHRIKIKIGGGIDPPTLEGVEAKDKVTIANRSGIGATISYPVGANPFSDVQDGTSETLPDGGDTEHRISADFDPSANYDLPIDLEEDEFLGNPRIRITGGGER